MRMSETEEVAVRITGPSYSAHSTTISASIVHGMTIVESKGANAGKSYVYLVLFRKSRFHAASCTITSSSIRSPAENNSNAIARETVN